MTSFRYERNPELSCAADLYFMQRLDDAGEVVESFTTDDPGREIEAYRETEDTTIEQRLEPYGLRFEQETEARP
jgi:hypothetical protein